ncbi:MAG: DoxX family protein [Cyclobacteriaceae bacterium]|nr:DoxX family protein [Cyclobacteriaceae bacterium]
MKKTNIIYWIFTGLMTAMIGIGGIFDAFAAKEAVEHITRIGYPEYLVPFLGVAKVLGLIAILVPGFPRLKEWAYAGIVYDLAGAMYSHIAFGDGPSEWAGFFIMFGIIAGSYIYHHKRLREKAAVLA